MPILQKFKDYLNITRLRENEEVEKIRGSKIKINKKHVERLLKVELIIFNCLIHQNRHRKTNG